MDAAHPRFERTDPLTGKLDPEGSCWVAEASEIGFRPGMAPQSHFLFENCPRPGMMRTFHLVDTDMSGGDVAGWRFEEDPGPNKGNTSYKDPGNPQPCPALTILIIND